LLSEYQVGILCENTVESIRGNLQLIYNQDDYYNQLKAQCVAAKKVWNWEIESQKLIELYCYD
jgi:uridine kinase